MRSYEVTETLSRWVFDWRPEACNAFHIAGYSIYYNLLAVIDVATRGYSIYFFTVVGK